jgi:Tol biopolymer transport system component
VIDRETGKVSRLSRAEWQTGWNHWEPGEPEVVNPRPRLTGTLSDVTWPVWSPDARFIAFTRDGLLAIADADAVSNSGRWFLFKDEPPADEAIGWSRDGSKVLFSIEGFLAVAELDKDRWGDVHALSTRRVLRAGRRGAGTFNAAGTRVVFSAAPAGKRNHELFVVDVTGENEQRITGSAADLQEPRWRPVIRADSDTEQGVDR